MGRKGAKILILPKGTNTINKVEDVVFDGERMSAKVVVYPSLDDVDSIKGMVDRIGKPKVRFVLVDEYYPPGKVEKVLKAIVEKMEKRLEDFKEEYGKGHLAELFSETAHSAVGEFLSAYRHAYSGFLSALEKLGETLEALTVVKEVSDKPEGPLAPIHYPLLSTVASYLRKRHPTPSYALPLYLIGYALLEEVLENAELNPSKVTISFKEGKVPFPMAVITTLNAYASVLKEHISKHEELVERNSAEMKKGLLPEDVWKSILSMGTNATFLYLFSSPTLLIEDSDFSGLGEVWNEALLAALLAHRKDVLDKKDVLEYSNLSPKEDELLIAVISPFTFRVIENFNLDFVAKAASYIYEQRTYLFTDKGGEAPSEELAETSLNA